MELTKEEIRLKLLEAELRNSQELIRALENSLRRLVTLVTESK